MPAEWIMGLLGGVLIGSAAALWLLMSGRILGASGILGGLIDGTGWSRASERGLFIAGVIAAPLIISLFSDLPATNITSNAGLLIAGGLCVGIGTRMANGCTSGHGVCGISRLSMRGIVATVTYVGIAMLTMAVVRQGLGWV